MTNGLVNLAPGSLPDETELWHWRSTTYDAGGVHTHLVVYLLVNAVSSTWVMAGVVSGCGTSGST